MRIEESIDIDCPADEAFAFFDDRANDRLWMDAVTESEWIDPDQATGIGRKGRMMMNVFGEREYADEVNLYVPGRKVGHRMVSGSMVFDTSCQSEPLTDTRTRVTVTYEPKNLPGGPVAKLFQPLILRGVRRNYRQDLRRLKELLEDRSRDDHPGM